MIVLLKDITLLCINGPFCCYMWTIRVNSDVFTYLVWLFCLKYLSPKGILPLNPKLITLCWYILWVNIRYLEHDWQHFSQESETEIKMSFHVHFIQHTTKIYELFITRLDVFLTKRCCGYIFVLASLYVCSTTLTSCYLTLKNMAQHSVYCRFSHQFVHPSLGLEASHLFCLCSVCNRVNLTNQMHLSFIHTVKKGYEW